MAYAMSRLRIVRHDRLVAEHRPVCDLDVSAEVRVAAGDRRTELRLAVHPRVRPENGSVDFCVLADMAVLAHDGVGADACAGFDDRAGVDEARTFDHRARLDSGFGRYQRGAGARREWRRDETAIHDVAVGLSILVRRSDVDPVAAIDVSQERLAFGHQ